MSKGEEVVFTLDSPKMHIRHRYRKLLQTLLVLVIVLYMGLLVYHSYYSGGNTVSEVPAKRKPFPKAHVYERTLAQEPPLNDAYEISFSTEISSATATVRPPATTLDDVFISVKTTRSYHSSRLPIILKTWFQLAKKQCLDIQLGDSRWNFSAAWEINEGSVRINNKELPYVIVGDPAYPLLPWLLKGFTGANLTEMEDSFNSYMNSARVVVEIAFGRLKARWRCLLKRLDVHHSFVPYVVAACCTLHNIVEKYKEDFTSSWLEAVEEAEIMFQQPNKCINKFADDYAGYDVRVFLSQYLADNYPLRTSKYGVP